MTVAPGVTPQASAAESIPPGRIADLVAAWGSAAAVVTVSSAVTIELRRPRPPRPLITGPKRANSARQAPPALPRRARTTEWLLKGCGRCGADLHWEEDRDAGPGRPPGAYGCLACGATV